MTPEERGVELYRKLFQQPGNIDTRKTACAAAIREAVAAEREACAAVADEESEAAFAGWGDQANRSPACGFNARDIAAAIRART